MAALAFASIALGLGAAPTAAFAGTEQFMANQGLSAGNSKSSTSAHSGLIVTTGTSDHSFCPSAARGYAGYTSSPNSGGNQTVAGNNCGPGWRTYSWNVGGDFWRGAVWNQNVSTYDNFESAFFSW